MIQPAAPILTPTVSTGKPAAPVTAGGGGPGSFALSLADFLTAADGGGDTSPPPLDAPGERQDDAADGNALPPEADADARTPDPTLAWFAFPTPGPVPPARPIAFPRSIPDPAAVDPAAVDVAIIYPAIAPAGQSTTTPIASHGDSDAAAAEPMVALAGESAGPPIPSPSAAVRGRTDPPIASPDENVPAAPQRAPATPIPDLRQISIDRDAPRPPDSPGVAKAPRIDRDVPVAETPDAKARPIAVAASIAAPAQPAATLAFAAAIHAVASSEERPVPDRQEDNAPITAIGLSPLEIRATAISATSDAQQSSLDLRQDRWPGAMIDRIEALRDSADAADTRIRLVPDALGTIDVSVRKDGDVVHVHFTAEQAATRSILQDAQPRLAELAEARGLKLGQTAVDSGGAGAGQQPPRQPQPIIPLAPARTPTRSEPTDTRIA